MDISNDVSFRTALAVRNLLFACTSNGLERKLFAPVCSQVFPRGIIFSNQSNFLFAPPRLDLGFSSNGIFNPFEALIPNQPCHFVFSGKGAGAPGLVAEDSRHQPSGHTDVEYSAFTRENVNLVAALF